MISSDILVRLDGETTVVAPEVNAGVVPLPEEGVTAPTVGAVSGTVQAPTGIHPEFTFPDSAAYKYEILSPAKAGKKVRFTVRLTVVAPKLTDVFVPLRRHLLFATEVAEPKTTGDDPLMLSKDRETRLAARS